MKVYFWILTCAWPDPATGYTATREMTGATEVEAGMTWALVYRKIRSLAAVQPNPIPVDAPCLFFSMEPNELVSDGGAR